jgi:glycosyltransferase involved in cell wall biosynthesis
MWRILKELPPNVKINVWVHGAEIQPWWRRECNYETKHDLDVAKAQSKIKIAFWHKVLTPAPENFHFIFVSRYLANEVMEDLQIQLPQSQYDVIHNPIDTKLFNYIHKPAVQRKKILSIRPYTSINYANDLSVQAVLMLSKKPWFSELEFRFIGDGKLFDGILAPIKAFENVVIEKGFLRQSEIADLHKQFGIFLCPTRMDTQGVSKDEAMSSGLVVISNAVTAIPEFIDENCGILADKENAEQLALGIEALFRDEALFNRLSRNASERVRQQTCSSLIVEQELRVIKNEAMS